MNSMSFADLPDKAATQLKKKTKHKLHCLCLLFGVDLQLSFTAGDQTATMNTNNTVHLPSRENNKTFLLSTRFTQVNFGAQQKSGTSYRIYEFSRTFSSKSGLKSLCGVQTLPLLRITIGVISYGTENMFT